MLINKLHFCSIFIYQQNSYKNKINVFFAREKLQGEKNLFKDLKMVEGETSSKDEDHSHPMRRSQSILDDSHVKVNKNQILLYLLKLPFTAVSSGLGKLSNSSDNEIPGVCNPEMFTLEQLYGLRSELIQLKAFIEQQNTMQSNLYLEISHIVRNFQTENLVEREVRRIRFPKSEVKAQPAPEIKPEEKPEQPAKSQTKKLNSKNHSHHKDKHRHSDEPKPLTADTIWKTTDRFFKPIKTANYFDRYLQLSRPTYDINKIQEPLGTHYSITFSKMASFQNDPLKSQLKMPTPPFSKLSGSGNHIHNRLVSAILDVSGNKEDSNSMTSDSEFNQETDKIDSEDQSKAKLLQNKLANLSRSSFNCLPVGSRIGNSAYGQLDFEKRLHLELESLGIKATGQTIVDTNYPVSHYISDKVAQQRFACEQANRCRRMIEQYVALGQRKFADVVRRNRDWNSALSIYLQQEAKEKGSTKKKTKSHSTKPIVEEEYSMHNSTITSAIASETEE